MKHHRLITWTFCAGLAFLALPSAVDGDVLCRNKKGDINARDTCKADEAIVDVREADDEMVKGCEYLGDVTASSGWGGLAQGMGQSRARKSAFKRAAQKGATHLVWSRQSSGMGGGNASARAYKCEPPDSTT